VSTRATLSRRSPPGRRRTRNHKETSRQPPCLGVLPRSGTKTVPPASRPPHWAKPFGRAAFVVHPPQWAKPFGLGLRSPASLRSLGRAPQWKCRNPLSPAALRCFGRAAFVGSPPHCAKRFGLGLQFTRRIGRRPLGGLLRRIAPPGSLALTYYLCVCAQPCGWPHQ